MIKKLKRKQHFEIRAVLNSLNIVDKDNIKAAIWLARSIKAIDNTINIELTETLEKKLTSSAYITEMEKIKKEAFEVVGEKNESGELITEEVKSESGEVIGLKYKIPDEKLGEVEAIVQAKVKENSESIEALKTQYETNRKDLNDFYDEELEIDYPTLPSDVYEKAFEVNIQQIFVIEDLLQ